MPTKSYGSLLETGIVNLKIVLLMSGLTVYRASAGSGKTYCLTAEYLKLLVRDPMSYAHILAVTFTNKATNEMKERIVSELYGLATGSRDSIGMLHLLQQETQLSEAKIIESAHKSLFYVLHDYSRFRVETIDSFFQSVMRNLAKELGIGAYLNIVLQYDEILREAIDRMIESTRHNAQLLHWVSDYIEEKIEEGKNWRISDELNHFGRSIFLEVFQEKAFLLEKKISDKQFLNKYRARLLQMRKTSLEKLQRRGNDFLSLIKDQGLSIDDFSYKEKGVVGYFKTGSRRI